MAGAFTVSDVLRFLDRCLMENQRTSSLLVTRVAHEERE